MTEQDLTHQPGAVALPRNREVALARAFADLAGGLTGDFDVSDLLHGLAGHCVDLLDAAACGILLTDPHGRLTVVAAHSAHAQALELLQVHDDQGPCVDCVRTGEPVRSGDLAADAHRWPGWAPTALAHGIRTVYATPLRTQDTVIGTLNLFGTDPSGMSESQLLIVRALTDVATITVLAQRSTEHAEQLNTQLQTALESRVRIEQAKGILAHAHALALAIDMDEAFQLLRHNSRTTNVKLTRLADLLIDGRITTADLLPLPRHA